MRRLLMLSRLVEAVLSRLRGRRPWLRCINGPSLVMLLLLLPLVANGFTGPDDDGDGDPRVLAPKRVSPRFATDGLGSSAVAFDSSFIVSFRVAVLLWL